jgi:hypothetical protein
MQEKLNWNVVVTSNTQFQMVLDYIESIKPRSGVSGHRNNWGKHKRLYVSCRTYSWNYHNRVDGCEEFNAKTRISWSDFLKMSGNTIAIESVQNKPLTLTKGKTIELYGNNYEVRYDSDGWFLNCEGFRNDRVFDFLGMEDEDKYKLQKEVLGYEKHGVFPYCKSLEDLTKFVNAIKNYKKQTIHMQKELIGYKLSGKASANQIAKFLECDPGTMEIDGHDLFFVSKEHPTAIQKAQDAGVLDIWFEPVYSSKPQYKVGDRVTVISDMYTSHKTSNNPTFQITGLNKQGVHSELTENGGWIYFADIRKATPAEIEAAQSIKIDSYEVQIVNRTLTRIAGYNFTKEFWEAALVIAQNSKAAVWVGCGAKEKDSAHKWTVGVETITKIINRLK